MNDKFKVELILPRQKGALKASKTFVPHIGLATVAALTPKDVEISLTDERISDVDLLKNVDMVGISTVTTTAPRAYEIADSFRERGIKVVLGGIHPSYLPEEAGRHADAVVIGEAEGIWPLVVEDGKAGRLSKIYKQEKRPDPNCWVSPRRDLIIESAYWIPAVVSTSRGCPFSCSFCAASSFFGHTYRTRPLDAIVDEFEQLKKNRFFQFVDDNIVGNPELAKELFRSLIPYKKRWAAQAPARIGKDDELIELAARSGCFAMYIGFESISQESLNSMNKRANKVDEYEDVVRRLHSHGIGVHGCFLFGFDEDDESVFRRTVDFCRKLKLDSASFGVVVPLPGTALYESLLNSGRIVTKDWTLYDRAVFEPKQMTREALDNGTAEAWREFYSLRNICSRLVARPTASGLFFRFVNLYVHYRYLPQRGDRLRASSNGM